MLFIEVDGVLRTDTGALLHDGKQLLTALLASTTRTVLYSPDDQEVLKRYLDSEGITKYASLASGDFEDALRNARAETNSITLVVTADPAHAFFAAQQGISVCLFHGKNYVRPDWKPSRKTWEAIVHETDLHRSPRDSSEVFSG